ncbi:MAG: lipopolysaccharide biosynthesis protein [Acetobacterales bacterium]
MANPPDQTGGRADKDRHFNTDHLQANLARRSMRGGAITLTAQAVKVAAQTGAIVLLARLLSPDDFGLFAMIAAFLTVLELFKDLGLSGATVQRKEITDLQVSTLFWMNTVLGAAATVLLAAAAPLLAWFYREPILIEITIVVSLSMLLTGAAAQHLALLRRQMRFSALAAVQTGAEVVALAAAVVAAMNGFGIWSLVVQRLVWAGVSLLGAWAASGWVPGRPGRFSDVRSLVVFGGNATGAMLIGGVAANLDRILIGWYWGAAPLGLFERSQKLMMMPIRNLNMPLASVALPMLSRLVDQPERYRRAYYMAAERLAMMFAPVTGLVVAGSGPLVELILGPQWSGAAPLLGWMGITAVYMPLTYTISWLYMSQDRTGEMVRANLINTSMTLVILLVALPYGTVAIAAAFSLSGLLLRTPMMFYLVGRRGPISLRDIAQILSVPAVAAVAATAAVWAAGKYATAELGIASPFPYVVLLTATATATSVAIYLLFPGSRRVIIETLRMPRMMLADKTQQA